MQGLHKVTFLLLLIGGLNWLLVGVLGWDVGDIFGGQGALVSRIIYILVGIAAVLELVGHKKNCKNCVAGKVEMGGGAPAQSVPPSQPAQPGM